MNSDDKSPLDIAQTVPNQAPIAFSTALGYWFKLGLISFGGPAGQISLMHQELVEKRRWISERRFLHALNYTMVLPGPEAQQLATYIGWLMHGVWGGIAAGILFVLPSLLLLIGLSWGYLEFGNSGLVAGMLYGVKPAITAVVLFAAYRIGSKTLQNTVLRAIAVLAFVAIYLLELPFPYIVLIAAGLGLVGSYYWPEIFKAQAHTASASHSYGSAVIDDHTPVPRHAQFSGQRCAIFLSVGLLIWAAAMLGLIASLGLDGTLTQMGLFFSKAALVTFGGAYAVLPYVYQGGVEHYAWLSGQQMIDGLALGETTPGPLIMVVAFVGFVGAWGAEVFGSDALLLAGIAGAAVATLFTFLPSFLFILVGGPLIEASRHNLKFTAPLTAISAAVVGVIVNLAVFFAGLVLWPQGYSGDFDWLALLLAVSAFVALYRFKVGVVTVIICAAIAGMACLLLPSFLSL